MISPNAVRTVQAAQVAMLIAFFAWIPFCFKGMQSVAPHERAAFAEASIEMDEPWSIKLLFAKNVEANCTIADTQSAASQTPGPSVEAESESKAHCLPSHSRLALLPSLVALIGGGVFSFEAFKAFPML